MTKITSTDEWCEAIKKHIEKLKDNEKYRFAHEVIFNAALWSGYNDYEIIGILEAVKADLIKAMQNTYDCDGDCENCGLNDDCDDPLKK